MNGRQILWDIPTRIFHWTLVPGVALAWWSAEEQFYTIHQWTGYTLLVLVVSRIIWGFVGSRHSRFSDFVTGPQKVIAYIKGQGSPTPGHNPLGALSVLALLGLLLLQAVSGLFNNDDILFSGPLYYAAGEGLRDVMHETHEIVFNLILGLVALHIAVVVYHQRVRRDGMITAMFAGYAPGRGGLEAPRNPWLALLVAAAVAGALWYGLSLAPRPAPVW